MAECEGERSKCLASVHQVNEQVLSHTLELLRRSRFGTGILSLEVGRRVLGADVSLDTLDQSQVVDDGGDGCELLGSTERLGQDEVSRLSLFLRSEFVRFPVLDERRREFSSGPRLEFGNGSLKPTATRIHCTGLVEEVLRHAARVELLHTCLQG